MHSRIEDLSMRMNLKYCKKGEEKEALICLFDEVVAGGHTPISFKLSESNNSETQIKVFWRAEYCVQEYIDNIAQHPVMFGTLERCQAYFHKHCGSCSLAIVQADRVEIDYL